jgi:Rieske Fe-S protein
MTTHDDCGGGCGRRDFISGGVTLLALATLFAPTAGAMPVRFASALLRRGTAITYPVPATDGVTIDRDEGVIIARAGQQVFAFSLTCPHQNTALRWQAKANEFQCPKHKSRYRPDGVFIAGRATRAMDRFAISRDGANLVVDVDRLYEADKQPTEWSAAVVAL